MSTPYVTGYCDRLTVKAGEAQRFMVSGEGIDAVDLQIVRLIHGDENPAGPGFIEREVAASCNGRIPVTHQFTQVGSFIRVADLDRKVCPSRGFTAHAFIWPTTPGRRSQAILSRWVESPGHGPGMGFWLGINTQGRLALRLGNGAEQVEVSADTGLVAKVWYLIAASYDAATHTVTLYQEPVINPYNGLLSRIVPLSHQSHVMTRVAVAPADIDDPLIFAGHHATGSHGRCV